MREYTYHSGNFLEIKYMYYLRELIGCKKSIQKKKTRLRTTIMNVDFFFSDTFNEIQLD